jgi:hypothetical protein
VCRAREIIRIGQIKTAWFAFVAGKPAPTVSWFINDKLQENVVPLEDEQMVPGVIINNLSIRDVRRHQLHNTFKCQASNTKMMQPKERTVRLDLACKFSIILTHAGEHNLKFTV